MKKKIIRVVVPCRCADNTVRACVDAIFQSQLVTLEVVLVDDGGNYRLSSLEKDYSLIIIKTEGGVGAGAARNHGLRDYKGDIIVFVDSDVAVEKYSILNLVAPIREGLADATVGRYSDQVSDLRLSGAYKQLYLAYTYGKHDGKLANTFWTALGAVKTELFFKVSGFSTFFRNAGPEDIEFGMKITRENARILAVPDATAKHLCNMYFLDLCVNDIRKGSEDVYIHWLYGSPITDNRHAGLMDIAAVFFSYTMLLIIILPELRSTASIVMVGCSYLILRSGLLIKGYLYSCRRLFLIAIPMTFILDIARGFAVGFGTFLACVDVFSGGRLKPFNKTIRTK